MSGFIETDGDGGAPGSPIAARKTRPRSLSFNDETEIFTFENQHKDDTSDASMGDELVSPTGCTHDDDPNEPGSMRFCTLAESRRVKRSATAHVDSLPSSAALAMPARSRLWQRRHSQDSTPSEEGSSASSTRN